MRAIYYDGTKIITPIIGDTLPANTAAALVSDAEFVYYNSLPSYRKLFFKVVDGAVVEKSQQETAPFYSEQLSYIKTQKKANIDRRTDSIIAGGFTFDSHTFSLSTEAQANWLGLVVAKDMLDYSNGGYAVTTKDDQEYKFANSTAVVQFFATGIGYIAATVAAGRALKIQVDACTTIEQVEAIVDGR